MTFRMRPMIALSLFSFLLPHGDAFAQQFTDSPAFRQYGVDGYYGPPPAPPLFLPTPQDVDCYTNLVQAGLPTDIACGSCGVPTRFCEDILIEAEIEAELYRRDHPY